MKFKTENGTVYMEGLPGEFNRISEQPPVGEASQPWYIYVPTDEIRVGERVRLLCLDQPGLNLTTGRVVSIEGAEVNY